MGSITWAGVPGKRTRSVHLWPNWGLPLQILRRSTERKEPALRNPSLVDGFDLVGSMLQPEVGYTNWTTKGTIRLPYSWVKVGTIRPMVSCLPQVAARGPNSPNTGTQTWPMRSTPWFGRTPRSRKVKKPLPTESRQVDSPISTIVHATQGKAIAGITWMANGPGACTEKKLMEVRFLQEECSVKEPCGKQQNTNQGRNTEHIQKDKQKTFRQSCSALPFFAGSVYRLGKLNTPVLAGVSIFYQVAIFFYDAEPCFLT